MAYRKDMIWLAVFFGLLMLAPALLPNNYYLTILILGCLHAMNAVGLCLLVGHAGQISLGHAGFYGLGAYTSSYLSTTVDLSVGLSMLSGVALTVVVSILVGLPSLKLKGHYLAMATLGFGIILSILFTETVDITGGPSGFVGIPRLSFFGFELRKDVALYRAVAVMLCLIVWLAFNLLHSRVGRALRALHTSERAAEAMGVDIARYKLLVFVLSAAFSSIAGVLYAHYLTFIAPSSFGFMFSVELIVMVVLGGMISVPGAIVGAFFVTVLPEFLRAFENIEVLLFGAILILCMMFLPDGMAGGWNRLWSWGKARLSGVTHG
ncbi:amino acid/amide ABC transporter membrane protein 2, HAAT family [Desulfomicrobium apsheronum]|uniref:Amino acid/amide ABC transporter membrane protein 2, HAAT family n=1 Tax=Desulfomicrobium apsheronum TaxID=52560 RepID=A0A1I3UMA1_9BACT|nr:branched-chain amino acid ABC transporter permease [Desulfomicrobium apsheronum]SFJ83046.1 amino acid/amide ABC transporter membrane protein 2, HAAT family [Desulfomicrobium apsheronum]